MSAQITPAAADPERPADAGPAPAAARRPARRSAGAVLRSLGRPKVGLMLALGFSSGLPFMLVGNTFNYWLADDRLDLKVIGFASWVGLSYTLQFLLAAVVDNLKLPWLARLGRRRSWMLLTQVTVAAGLFGMAASDPRTHLAQSVAFAVLAAFASASQDVAMNAWRIETAVDAAELDLLTSAYSLGYRVANILTQAVILFMAQVMGWAASYGVFAALMAVGVAATLAVREPARADAVLDARERAWSPLRAWPLRAWDVVAGPFIAFFRSYGVAALLVLLAVTGYHLCDYLRGPMIAPFYVQLGLSKPLVASLRLSIGIPTALLGIAAGGLYAARFGHLNAMIVGGVLQPLAVASFSLLVLTGPSALAFGAVLAWDDFCTGFAGVVLIAYISTLTTLGYTATQYALLVSAVNFTGKTLKGFSGSWVKGLAHGGRDLLHAYALYFVYCALVAIPALLLVLALAWIRRRPAPADAVAAALSAPA